MEVPKYQKLPSKKRYRLPELCWYTGAPDLVWVPLV
jgi:hypothetical protein